MSTQQHALDITKYNLNFTKLARFLTGTKKNINLKTTRFWQTCFFFAPPISPWYATTTQREKNSFALPFTILCKYNKGCCCSQCQLCLLLVHFCPSPFVTCTHTICIFSPRARAATWISVDKHTHIVSLLVHTIQRVTRAMQPNSKHISSVRTMK